MKRLDEKKSIERNELAAGASGTPIGASPGLLGGSVHGTMAAKAKSSPSGGPSAANQFQQQNPAPQSILQESQDRVADAANKPAMANAAPASASQAVTVQAKEWIPRHSLLRPHHPGFLNVAIQPEIRQRLSKAQKIIAAQRAWRSFRRIRGGRSIALDTAGAMFLSEDDGKHWQPIRTQWTGRAVLVRTRPVETQQRCACGAARPLRFELVNDNLQTWVSSTERPGRPNRTRQ